MQNEAEAGTTSGRASPIRDDGGALGATVPRSLASVAGAVGLPAEMYAAAFRASPIALALARDPHCAVVLRNPAMNRILPASLDWRAWRLPDGSAPPLFEAGAPVSLEQQPLRRAAFRGEPTTGREMELRWPGREPVHLRISATPLLDAAGAPCGAIGSAVDISADKRAEHARLDRSRSEDANRRAKDELLGLMGHELRNPLNAIATAVEVMNRAEPTAPEAHSARRIIGRQTRRLAELICELGDAGRVLVDRVELVRVRLDVEALVRECVLRAGPRIEAAKQRVRLDLAAVRIDADASQLADAIDGLLDDALRSAPADGTVGVRLRQAAGPHGAEAIFAVGDLEALDRLGTDDPASAIASRDGTASRLGLSLARVRHVVEQHGGRIDARRRGSAAGGDVLVVRLPAPNAAPDPTFPSETLPETTDRGSSVPH